MISAPPPLRSHPWAPHSNRRKHPRRGKGSHTRLPTLAPATAPHRERWWQSLLFWPGNSDGGPPFPQSDATSSSASARGMDDDTVQRTAQDSACSTSVAWRTTSTLCKTQMTASATSTLVSGSTASRKTMRSSQKNRRAGPTKKVDPRQTFNDMSLSERAEASVAFVALSQNHPAIVRGPLDKVVQLQQKTAADLSKRYKGRLQHLKDEQAAWRRRQELQATMQKRRGELACNSILSRASPKSSEGSDDEEEAEQQFVTELSEEESQPILTSRLTFAPSPTDSTSSPRRTTPGASSLASPLASPKASFVAARASQALAQEAFLTDRAGSGPATPPKGVLRAKEEARFDFELAARRASSMPFNFFASIDEESDSGVQASMLRSRTTVEPRSLSGFDAIVQSSKQHGIQVAEMRKLHQDFMQLDVDGNGWICMDEFKQAVRDRCNILESEDLPAHLLNWHFVKADKNNDGKVDFEDYVLWHISNGYCEEVLVTDRKERQLRKIARNQRLPLYEVERLKKVFDSFDQDGSGVIEEGEFRNAIIMLMNVKNPEDVSTKRLRRFWTEVDIDRNGSISFEEFLVWYCNVFDG